MDFPQKSAYTFEDLRRLVACLRAPDGCPWDREQTHTSIRRDFIEETYEAVEAIDRDDPALLCEELGDVLFQVAFHTRIEEERGRFSMEDVLTGIVRKMVTRHPHVFGSVSVSGTGEVLRNWESIKNAVKGVESRAETLRLVPETFPALMRADKLLKRADQAGADGTRLLAGRLEASLDAFRASEGKEDGEKALGALLLAVTAAAREKGLDAEMALLAACKGFTEDFARAEDTARENPGSLARTLAETLPPALQEALDG